MSVILPGSYDPVTKGHLDIIRRAAEKYDEVYVVVFTNPKKNYMFSVEDRARMLMIATDDLDNVLVSYSNGLVIDYMTDHEISKIINPDAGAGRVGGCLSLVRSGVLGCDRDDPQTHHCQPFQCEKCVESHKKLDG